MKSLLVINSSAAREGSVSRTLVEDTVARLLRSEPIRGSRASRSRRHARCRI